MEIASTAEKRANPMLVLTLLAPEGVEVVRSGTGGLVAVAPTPPSTGPFSGVYVQNSIDAII